MVRPNVKIEMTNRELHEAMAYKDLYEGKAIDPLNALTWFVITLVVGGFWWWLMSQLPFLARV
jgi:hypothetical protein